MKQARCYYVAAALLAAATFVVACTSPSGPTVTPPAGAVVVTANQNRFEQASVTAPAGQAFTIWFHNREGVPHNVNVADAGRNSLARGEIFSGPAAQTLEVPSLTAGSYQILCDVHPDMRAELVVN